MPLLPTDSNSKLQMACNAEINHSGMSASKLSTDHPLRVGIIAGEASGDALGNTVIQALQAHYPKLVIEGIGGPAMQAVGCQSFYDMEQLNVMGLIEPLKRLPRLFKIRQHLLRYFLTNPPDVFIGIDAPDFNIGLELALKQAGIRTIHVVSPSVWAWRRYRIHKIKRAVDKMLTLLPFEADFYQAHAVPVHFIGHPLAQQIPLQVDKQHYRQVLGLAQKTVYVAILPGSRKQEINYLAPVFLQAAQLLSKLNPEIHFITSHLRTDRLQRFLTLQNQHAPNIKLTPYQGKMHEVLAAADCAMITSGTATLEAMLWKTPMVIAYKMSKLTYALAWLLGVKRPIGLPNLIAGELIVPELIQNAAHPEKIAELIMDYLAHPLKVIHLQNIFLEQHKKMLMDSQRVIGEAITALLRR